MEPCLPGAPISAYSFTLINQWTGWVDRILSFKCTHFPLGAHHRASPCSPIGIITERLVIRPVYGVTFFRSYHRRCHDVHGRTDSHCLGPNDEVMPVPLVSWVLDLFDVVYRSILLLLLS